MMNAKAGNSKQLQVRRATSMAVPAGKYELTLQRRLSCCSGPMVDSNTISFEVVP
ncbi:MAG TPA: hypothetical protein VHS05_25975 [Pyrinomonadaceae bacterium]|nr:hypothetical protein [Pyrinomonadaceae bacterium]